MAIQAFKFVLAATTLLVADAVPIDHAKVEPFIQPDPVTLSERLGVKYKPSLDDQEGCAVFPVVNAAGEVTGGLKISAGRSGWYEDNIFPKGLCMEYPVQHHDWASAVVWLGDPEAESPTVSGLSYLTSDTKYKKEAPPSGDNASLASVTVARSGGGELDLIIWEQLTDAARMVSLNTTDFGEAEVPFNDVNFKEGLEKAWPYGTTKT